MVYIVPSLVLMDAYRKYLQVVKMINCDSVVGQQIINEPQLLSVEFQNFDNFCSNLTPYFSSI